jgi:hypothetical protein
MVSPNDEELERVESSEALIEPAEFPPEPPPLPPVRRKRRSLLGRLLTTLLILAIVAGAALYAAITFKDRDERLKVVADYAEPYVNRAGGVIGELKDRLGSISAQKEPASPESGPETPPSSSAEAPLSPPTKPAETATEPSARDRRLEAAIESQNAAIESQKAAVAALQSRVESAEQAGQRALRAAESAEAAANAAKAAAEAAAKAGPIPGAAEAPAAPAQQGEHSALTASEQVTALEGRIDELGEEMKALRDRLESPKSETRAAPEASAPAKPAAASEGPAAVVVIAYALQRDFEAGRPYAVETKALTRLGADSAALAALAPFADKGAPTAAQLKADFAPAAKRIHALENGESGDLTQHLMKGASKLVRVRPSGQAPSAEAQTVEEKVAHIEAALSHDDLAQANAIFATLPEAAQNEAKDFGATLRARIDAGRAADDLLHGAIAALGAAKE